MSKYAPIVSVILTVIAFLLSCVFWPCATIGAACFQFVLVLMGAMALVVLKQMVDVATMSSR